MPVTLLSQLPDLSHIRFTATRTRAACDPPSVSANGLGTLHIDEQCLVFFSPDTKHGFSIDYPSIVIHAVSRNTTTPSDAGNVADAHLYCQLDGPFPGCAASEESDDDDEQFAELKFFPEDKRQRKYRLYDLCLVPLGSAMLSTSSN
ncbi:hypothetical protein IWW38_005001 [Coemansia aciculifera]|uniref:Uncharacterized protein n=1 Tax=Coemansia aciculifera TaxID=417176 RepID=A0ACC1LX10_9FUNG|nr:hypothetical protein IWW38_005001 [Coemansia aciculifera]